MAAIEWMRDGAPGLQVALAQETTHSVTVSPAEPGGSTRAVTVSKPSADARPAAPLPRDVPVLVDVPPTTKSVVLKALGDVDDEVTSGPGDLNESARTAGEDEFDYEPHLPEPPSTHHVAAPPRPVVPEVPFATPTLPFALSINTTGGIGAPTPVTTAVPSTWQSTGISKPQPVQENRKEHALPAPPAPVTFKQEDGEDVGDGSDPGPDKWTQRDITVLRDQLWELIRNIPPEQVGCVCCVNVLRAPCC
jgi:hypothetical protein